MKSREFKQMLYTKDQDINNLCQQYEDANKMLITKDEQFY